MSESKDTGFEGPARGSSDQEGVQVSVDAEIDADVHVESSQESVAVTSGNFGWEAPAVMPSPGSTLPGEGCHGRVRHRGVGPAIATDWPGAG